MGGYLIIQKLDTAQFDSVTRSKLVRRPRPQRHSIDEQTMPTTQILNAVVVNHPDYSGVLA